MEVGANVRDVVPELMARVRDEVLPRDQGIDSIMAAALVARMRHDLQDAEAALAQGDLARMVAVVGRLQTYRA